MLRHSFSVYKSALPQVSAQGLEGVYIPGSRNIFKVAEYFISKPENIGVASHVASYVSFNQGAMPCVFPGSKAILPILADAQSGSHGLYSFRSMQLSCTQRPSGSTHRYKQFVILQCCWL